MTQSDSVTVSVSSPSSASARTEESGNETAAGNTAESPSPPADPPAEMAVAALANEVDVEPQPRRFTYDPFFNQLTSVTDELSRYTYYEIDPANGNRLSEVRVFDGNPDVPTTDSVRLSSGPIDVVTNDINGDGHVDILAGTTDGNVGSVVARFGFAGRTFSDETALFSTEVISEVLAVNIDCDTDIDLILAHETTITTWLNDGVGNFTLSETLDAGRNSPASGAARLFSGRFLG